MAQQIKRIELARIERRPLNWPAEEGPSVSGVFIVCPSSSSSSLSCSSWSVRRTLWPGELIFQNSNSRQFASRWSLRQRKKEARDANREETQEQKQQQPACVAQMLLQHPPSLSSEPQKWAPRLAINSNRSHVFRPAGRSKLAERIRRRPGKSHNKYETSCASSDVAANIIWAVRARAASLIGKRRQLQQGKVFFTTASFMSARRCWFLQVLGGSMQPATCNLHLREPSSSSVCLLISGLVYCSLAHLAASTTAR